MLTTLLTIASITFIWAMSPWPDLIVVMKNAMSKWKLSWIFTSGWVWSAILIHAIVIWVWLGAIIQTSVLVYQIVKIWWALYLLYLAYQLLTSKTSLIQDETLDAMETSITWYLTDRRDGFVTNLLNPKFLVFVLALFSQMFVAQTGIWMYVLAGVVMWCTAFVRFSRVSIVCGNTRVKTKLNAIQATLQKIFGVLLAALWLKILFE
jgi:threonine/homoserine/homoserine lactone efflux protein